MIPLVPVIVSQNAYILYIRALRFGNPVQGTAACRYERQAAQSRRRSSPALSRLIAAKVRWTVCLSLTRLAMPALCYPTSRKRGLILEVKCKMMCTPFVGRFNFLYDFVVVALSRRSSPLAELRSLLRTAGWRICQRWCLTTRYLTCFN